MKVLGIDPGGSTGWALLDTTDPTPARYLASGELDADDPPAHLARLLAEHRPELVAIEKVGSVYAKDGFGTRMAGNLYDAGWTGGRLYDRAAALGYHVVTVEAPDVRRAFQVRAPKGKANAMVECVLRLRVPSWPPPLKTNNHERDAALAALFAADQGRLVARGLPIAAPTGGAKRPAKGRPRGARQTKLAI